MKSKITRSRFLSILLVPFLPKPKASPYAAGGLLPNRYYVVGEGKGCEFISQRKFSSEDIRRIFRVPPDPVFPAAEARARRACDYETASKLLLERL